MILKPYKHKAPKINTVYIFSRWEEKHRKSYKLSGELAIAKSASEEETKIKIW